MLWESQTECISFKCQKLLYVSAATQTAVVFLLNLVLTPTSAKNMFTVCHRSTIINFTLQLVDCRSPSCMIYCLIYYHWCGNMEMVKIPDSYNKGFSLPQSVVWYGQWYHGVRILCGGMSFSAWHSSVLMVLWLWHKCVIYTTLQFWVSFLLMFIQLY